MITSTLLFSIDSIIIRSRFHWTSNWDTNICFQSLLKTILALVNFSGHICMYQQPWPCIWFYPTHVHGPESICSVHTCMTSSLCHIQIGSLALTESMYSHTGSIMMLFPQFLFSASAAAPCICIQLALSKHRINFHFSCLTKIGTGASWTTLRFDHFDSSWAASKLMGSLIMTSLRFDIPSQWLVSPVQIFFWIPLRDLI